MLKRTILSFLVLILTLTISKVEAQLSGSNIMELQYGSIPGDSTLFPTIYDRFVVDYSHNGFKAGITLEQFHSPYRDRNYLSLSQVRLEYNYKRFEVKLGHFYETIGRGILLRSYEIKGAMLEDLSYRSRHYFHRDILGVSSTYSGKNLEVKLLYGKPLDNLFAPVSAESLRRPEDFGLVYSEYDLGKYSLGAAILIFPRNGDPDSYAMINSSGSITPALSYYIETAQKITDQSILDFSRDKSFALYGNINWSVGSFGISAEVKSYSDFLLGPGINEPPALVKEHSYRVLNRSTHVLQPLNEKGFQIEAFYTFNNLSSLTLNYTLAQNRFSRQFLFREYFAEYSFSAADVLDLRVFADYANDPFKGEINRISAGVSLSGAPDGRNGFNSDFEFQYFERGNDLVRNYVIGLGYTYRSEFTLNLVTEISNDPFLLDSENKRIWGGLSVKYQLSGSHVVSLFAGSRRGGPACNSGVCYEVLDFSGVELRLTTRF